MNQTSEDVVIAGLHGTLQKPAQFECPHLVVIVAGSGPSDRDGNSHATGTVPGAQTNTYRLLAEALAGYGIATFRYDKRGVGASRALVPDRNAAAKLVISDFADDLVKIVAGLQSRSEGQTIVIAGHSEGAMLAMMAASRVKASGLALLAGAGLPFIEVIERQLASKNLPKELAGQVNLIVSAYRNNASITEWPPALVSLFSPTNDNFIRSVAMLDPRDLLAPISAPVLVVGGGKDIQIDRQNFERLASVHPAGSELLWVEEMAHSLKVVLPTDSSPLDAYVRERPLSEAFVKGFVAWVKALPQ